MIHDAGRCTCDYREIGNPLQILLHRSLEYLTAEEFSIGYADLETATRPGKPSSMRASIACFPQLHNCDSNESVSQLTRMRVGPLMCTEPTRGSPCTLLSLGCS